MFSAVRRSSVIFAAAAALVLTLGTYSANATPSTADTNSSPSHSQGKPAGHGPRPAFHASSHIHITPTVGNGSPGGVLPNAATGDGSNLSYQGGRVLSQPTVYIIFWVPTGKTVGSSYKSLLPRFVGDMGSTNLAAVLRQYPSLAGPPQRGITLGGVWTDTSPYPNKRGSASNPLLDTDIQNEMYYAAGQNRSWIAPGHSAIYVIATARGAASCTDSSKSSCSFANVGPSTAAHYCGYHSVTADGAGGVYVNLPDSNNASATGCSFANFGLTAPNNGEADWGIKVLSHEIFETMSDPDYGTSAGFAWIDDQGAEVGDKCNVDFPSVKNNANLVVGTHRYLVQSEWSNAVAGCTLNYHAYIDKDAVRPGFDQATLSGNDDASAPAVDLGFSVQLGANSYSQAYPNNNGNLTFDGPDGTYTPHDLSLDTSPRVAPFFADVDTRPSWSASVTYGQSVVDGHAAFGVTWAGVGYYSNNTDKLNRFQVILIDRSDIAPGDVDIEFNYDQILWETGDASGGTRGLGGTAAVAGISLGSAGGAIELPGSGSPGALEDWGSQALIAGGGGTTHGRWLTVLQGGYFVA